MAEDKFAKSELSTEQEIKRRTLARQIEIDGKGVGVPVPVPVLDELWIGKGVRGGPVRVKEMGYGEGAAVELPATPVRESWGRGRVR